ncbi:MAG: stage 0 sporulation family protein [Peptococcaceae bacterium]|nr:stage 0 sporulation family protein [Peptococcaceae bacterium]
MEQLVVGIRFKKAGKIYLFDMDGHELDIGDGAIVETARGIEYGDVVVSPKPAVDIELSTPLKKVIRKADDNDMQQLSQNKEKEKRAYQVGLEKIADHRLPMKLVGVEQAFDGNKIIFYFVAEGRIDFRELVKDLAAVFRTRIELRQIGVRDEVKIIGGLGSCGRELCCSSWLSDFVSVSIRMAKDQNLSLNPAKISGICGRLMCCLKYEYECYEQAKEELPEIGKLVNTPDGEGRVFSINIFKKSLSVELKQSKIVKEYPHEQVTLRIKPATEKHGGNNQGNKPVKPDRERV